MQLISFDIGTKNLSYCLMNIDDLFTKPVEIIDWKVIDLTHGDTHRNLINFLDSLELSTTVSVVIENQSFNKLMVFISHIIYSYYLIKGNSVISFVNAIHKIRFISDSTKMSYKKRKEMTVDYLLNKLSGKWLNHLENSIKKDDLSDSYMNGVAWYFSQKCKESKSELVRILGNSCNKPELLIILKYKLEELIR